MSLDVSDEEYSEKLARDRCHILGVLQMMGMIDSNGRDLEDLVEMEKSRILYEKKLVEVDRKIKEFIGGSK